MQTMTHLNAPPAHPTSSRSAVNPRRGWPRAWPAGLVAAGLALSACGGGGHASSTPPTAAAIPTTAGVAVAAGDPDSPYCQTVRQWTVHELRPVDDSNPQAMNTYIDEYVAFNHHAAEQAPTEVADQWALVAPMFDRLVVPIFEKYGYDMARIGADATQEEQAVLDAPPPEAAAAQDAIHAYEALVCGSGQPPAAAVVFEGPPEQSYCSVGARLDGMFADAAAAADSPDALRALLASDEVVQLMSALVEHAPVVIRDDVQAVVNWEMHRGVAVLAEYDYDIRRLLLDGSAADRAVVQKTDPAIRDHEARVDAYEEQLCGDGS
jgi:hypothetical protein